MNTQKRNEHSRRPAEPPRRDPKNDDPRIEVCPGDSNCQPTDDNETGG
jgi:hypothetical protein